MPSSYGNAPVDQSVTLGAANHGDRHNEIWAFVDDLSLKANSSDNKSTTAARPSASSVSIGYQWFDTTLNRPIWSNGTSWRYADGTAA
jgi:hypothetical protein